MRFPDAPADACGELVTKREIAAALGVCQRTVTRYMAAGLPFVRLRNGRLRFDVSACVAWYSRPLETSAAQCARCGHPLGETS